MSSFTLASIALRRLQSTLLTETQLLLRNSFSISTASLSDIIPTKSSQRCSSASLKYMPSSILSSKGIGRRATARVVGKPEPISNPLVRCLHISGSSNRVSPISKRSFSIYSPLMLPQNVTSFMMFSRRQWWIFFGSLVTLGSGIVQYMELNGIDKLLEDVDMSLLQSPTLLFDTLRDAASYMVTSSGDRIPRSEKLIKLACAAATSPSVEDDIHATAIYFLLLASKRDYARDMIIANIDLKRLLAQYKEQIQRKQSAESTSLILAAAFSTMPPSNDKEAALIQKKEAIAKALPLLNLNLIGMLAQNPSTHFTIVESGFVKPALEAFTQGTEVPAGYQVLYELSKSEIGRRSLIENNAFEIMYSVFADTSSPLRKLYQERAHINAFNLVKGTISNMFKNDELEILNKYPVMLGGLSLTQKTDMVSYDAEVSKIALKWDERISIVAASAVLGTFWGCVRSALRLAYRRMPIPVLKNIFFGGLRASIGASMFSLIYQVGTEIKDDILVDERLFMTTSIVGTAAAIFAFRQYLLIFPFVLLPSSVATYVVKEAPSADKEARQRRIEQFKAASLGAQSQSESESE